MLTKNKNRKSHKDIVLTSHSIDRARDRIGDISLNDLKLMAYRAKYDGANIHELRECSREKFNISPVLMAQLQHRFNSGLAHDKFYIYKGYVFVFGGGHSRTLKTVVNMRQLINSLNKQYPQEVQYGL